MSDMKRKNGKRKQPDPVPQPPREDQTTSIVTPASDEKSEPTHPFNLTRLFQSQLTLNALTPVAPMSMEIESKPSTPTMTKPLTIKPVPIISVTMDPGSMIKSVVAADHFMPFLKRVSPVVTMLEFPRHWRTRELYENANQPLGPFLPLQ